METKERKYFEEQISILKNQQKFYESKIVDYNEPCNAKDYHFRARAKVELAEFPDFMIENSEKRKKYESAIQDLDEAIERETCNYDQMWNYHLRARAKVGIEEYESALDDLEKALQLDQNEHGRMWSHHLRARVFFEQKEFERAIVEIDEAEKLDPIEFENKNLRSKIERRD